MRIGAELQGARLNVSRTAELLPMDVGHFRRLIRRGVFPSPKRTAKGKPFYDYDLLVEIAGVLKAGVGKNSEEIAFYRRQRRAEPRPRQRRVGSPTQAQSDAYLDAVVEGCRQCGIEAAELTPERVAAVLAQEFGTDRPELAVAIPAVVRRIVGQT